VNLSDKIAIVKASACLKVLANYEELPATTREICRQAADGLDGVYVVEECDVPEIVEQTMREGMAGERHCTEHGHGICDPMQQAGKRIGQVELLPCHPGVCEICGEHCLPEMCSNCAAIGCEECMSGHACRIEELE
jgi:hypothetical protein